MNVAPGEDPTSLDLRALTTDPDPEDLPGMRYSIVGGAPAGLSASIDGQTLQVSADSGTPKGTRATLTVRIDDGQTEPVEGTVVVAVTASTRPLPTANDDTVAEAHQGTTVSVPVLDNDFNPFPDEPLKVVAAVTETGSGFAEVVGNAVEVSPAATFVGTMVVRYRIQDATADVDREVEGRIVAHRAGPARRRRARRPCRACRTAPSCCRGPRRPTTAPRSRATPCRRPAATTRSSARRPRARSTGSPTTSSTTSP